MNVKKKKNLWFFCLDWNRASDI